MSIASDLVVGENGFSVADFDRATIQDGATLPSVQAFDFKGVAAPNNVATIVITGTVPAGVTLSQPLNLPRGIIGAYLFVDPGVNTPALSGYRKATLDVTWQAGKFVYYQIRRFPVNTNPANDLYLIWQQIEGGQTVTASSAAYRVPSPGIELVVGTHDSEGDIYRQSFTGTLSSTVEVLGGPLSGTIQTLLAVSGMVHPAAGGNAVQQWSVPYSNFVTNLNTDVQKHENTFRLFGGTAAVAETPDYQIYLDYTKV